MELLAQWSQGAFLAVWGVAFALAYVALQRLVNRAHVRFAGAGIVPPPRHIWPPIQTQPALTTCLVALALAIGVLAASNPIASQLLGTPEFPPVGFRDEMYALVRAHVGLALELYFLRKLADNPRYKSSWVVAWYAFSVGLALWG